MDHIIWVHILTYSCWISTRVLSFRISRFSLSSLSTSMLTATVPCSFTSASLCLFIKIVHSGLLRSKSTLIWSYFKRSHHSAVLSVVGPGIWFRVPWNGTAEDEEKRENLPWLQYNHPNFWILFPKQRLPNFTLKTTSWKNCVTNLVIGCSDIGDSFMNNRYFFCHFSR